MKYLAVWILCLGVALPLFAQYQRNEAVPVDKVLFGQVTSVRNISQSELIQDRNHGWKTFGGALIGGTIGNQFGSGSGRAITTILGAIIGGSLANEGQAASHEMIVHLVELMITTEDGQEYLVVQDFDPQMPFQAKDKIRMIYLSDGTVRIDKQM